MPPDGGHRGEPRVTWIHLGHWSSRRNGAGGRLAAAHDEDGRIGGGRGGTRKGESSTHLCGGRSTQPALLVRGSSRRITIMRFRPANIRVINRRDSRLDRHRYCRPRADKTSCVDRVVPYQVRCKVHSAECGARCTGARCTVHGARGTAQGARCTVHPPKCALNAHNETMTTISTSTTAMKVRRRSGSGGAVDAGRSVMRCSGHTG